VPQDGSAPHPPVPSPQLRAPSFARAACPSRPRLNSRVRGDRQARRPAP
jgi:hypothetical protein